MELSLFAEISSFDSNKRSQLYHSLINDAFDKPSEYSFTINIGQTSLNLFEWENISVSGQIWPQKKVFFRNTVLFKYFSFLNWLQSLFIYNINKWKIFLLTYLLPQTPTLTNFSVINSSKIIFMLSESSWLLALQTSFTT